MSQTFYSPRICLLDAKGQEFPKKKIVMVMNPMVQNEKHHPTKKKSKLLGAVKIEQPQIRLFHLLTKGEDPSH